MTPRFFPYRPTRLRAVLAACAIAGVALGASSLRRVAQGLPLASARAVAAFALAGAFVWLAWRLRPRAGYGVRIDFAGAEIARALDGRPERLLWTQISRVQRLGRWEPRWELVLTDGTRRELPGALFSDRAVFADLGRALTRPAEALRADV